MVDGAKSTLLLKGEEPVVSIARKGFFGRFGSALLDTQSKEGDPEAIRTALIASLESDSRVSSVYDMGSGDEWSHATSFYPLDNECPHCLVTGEDAFEGLKLHVPLYFQLHIPRKNQPIKMGSADVPTEDYWVAWDGVTILVLWDRALDESYPATSAGHVAYDVLSDAAKKSEMLLREQACSPACTNLFAHSELVIQAVASQDPETAFVGGDGALIDCRVTGPINPLGVMSILSANIFSTAHQFAQYKNCTQRILDIEARARFVVGRMLMLDAAELEIKPAGLRNRIKYRTSNIARWLKHDGRGVRSRRMSSELWLAMASIELLHRDHLRIERDMNDYMSQQENLALFEIDLSGSQESVSAIKLDFIRAAVEQRSTRRDNVTLAWATGLGAVAGGSVGVLGSLLAGS